MSVFVMGLLLLNQSASNAQDKSGAFGIGSESTLGAVAGVNMANVNGTDFDTESRTGVMLGVYYSYLLAGGSLYLQPELIYSQQGWKEGDITTKLDYVNLNILLAYYLANAAPVNPFIKAGPQIGFNVNAKRDFDGDELDLSDGVNNTSFGATVQAGVKISRYEVALGITQGFNTVFDSEESDAKNWLIDAGITFWF